MLLHLCYWFVKWLLMENKEEEEEEEEEGIDSDSGGI